MGSMDRVEGALPPIPAKRYFTIGEVSELCLVKPYVLRYWEQEFVQLKPMKRRGNRRYYQHHEVLLIRRIRELLYDQGFTISGARNQLADMVVVAPVAEELDSAVCEPLANGHDKPGPSWREHVGVLNGAAGGAEGRTTRALQANALVFADSAWVAPHLPDLNKLSQDDVQALREALLSIRDMLS
jgi:DNA-binding transcriptional MerR regulator